MQENDEALIFFIYSTLLFDRNRNYAYRTLAYSKHLYTLLTGYVITCVFVSLCNSDRDACGKDEWDSKDLMQTSTSTDVERLKPNTRYAFYIKAIVGSTSNSSFISDIVYYTTRPATPDSPLVNTAKQDDVGKDYITVRCDSSRSTW